jgi:DEAD/DEAH box helicase domain-containing protein
MINEVIFDLETKKFFDETGRNDPSELGVSIVSLYKRRLDENFNEIEGELLSFWEDEFSKMWPIFEEATRIIGFNSLGFDVPALSPYAPAYFPKLPHFDILAKIKEVGGRRVSLDALAKETLGKGKIDSGKNATSYWQKGDLESLAKLKKYCESDVLITKEVYNHGLKNGTLKFKDFWNNLREIEVDFSYPKDIIAKVQTSLF